jgi:uncharacterized membrane protein YsdA (DUF1294 family)/cold shock CspA family protein
MPKPSQPKLPGTQSKTPVPPNKVRTGQTPKAPAPPQEKLPTGVQQGYVVMVNPKDGYGFIRPNGVERAEGRDVYFNVRQIEGRKTVRAGQSVSYFVTRTEKGIAAIQVRPGSVFSIPYLRFLLIGVAMALLLLAGLTLVLDRPSSLALWIGLWAISFSIATYGVYWYDKVQAQAGGLRVPEVVLHLLGALGGTPGAFIAMRRLPHKIRDHKFQAIFWLTVAVQAGVLGWYFFLS